MPAAVQIAVPTRDRPPQISQPPTEVFRFDTATFELGLSSVEAAKGSMCGSMTRRARWWI